MSIIHNSIDRSELSKLYTDLLLKYIRTTFDESTEEEIKKLKDTLYEMSQITNPEWTYSPDYDKTRIFSPEDVLEIVKTSEQIDFIERLGIINSKSYEQFSRIIKGNFCSHKVLLHLIKKYDNDIIRNYHGLDDDPSYTVLNDVYQNIIHETFPFGTCNIVCHLIDNVGIKPTSDILDLALYHKDFNTAQYLMAFYNSLLYTHTSYGKTARTPLQHMLLRYSYGHFIKSWVDKRFIDIKYWTNDHSYYPPMIDIIDRRLTSKIRQFLEYVLSDDSYSLYNDIEDSNGYTIESYMMQSYLYDYKSSKRDHGPTLYSWYVNYKYGDIEEDPLEYQPITLDEPKLKIDELGDDIIVEVFNGLDNGFYNEYFTYNVFDSKKEAYDFAMNLEKELRTGTGSLVIYSKEMVHNNNVVRFVPQYEPGVTLKSLLN